MAGQPYAFGAPGGLAPGTRVAGYVIEEQVGAGGMAVVFRARDEVLGRLAAIKVLAPALSADPEFRARFLRESRAVASVDEPHIIPVYGAGEAGGMLYIATRFVAGGDLGALLRRSQGPVAPERAAALIAQVASALDAAHRAGLVHRDVKPGNILVDQVPGQDEHAYLSDFGLTKSTSSETGLTATGQFLGTPDYCAPEQIRGRQVDGRTDQYALACVAFALLAGAPPFRRPEAVATLFAHLNDPVPAVARARPGLPPALDPVLDRAMAKDPQDRFASCGEFAAGLQAALVPEPAGSAQGNGGHGQPGDAPAGNPAPAADVTIPAGNTQSVPRAPFLPQSSSRARSAGRRRTVVLAGSVTIALAAAGTVTALLLPGAAHGTGSLPPPPSTPASSQGAATSAPAASGTINGAGSTFQTNFQQAAISEFKSVDSGVTVNYESVGSGTGRSDLYSNTLLFAGSDSPIPAPEQSKVPAGKTVLYFPVQVGPIAIAYNLPGVTGLKLDAAILAGIFQGQINVWNDPAIKALNPGASLPSTSITLEVRSDGSATTANFSQYLVDAAGSAWKLGSASTITWPSTAHANNGGSAVAVGVESTAGSIGYVDFSTATASGLSAASIKNSAGDFVAPSTAGATAAASHVTPKAGLTFAAVDQPGATSYPITYQSWDLVYAKQPNANDVALLKAYLGYLLSSTGQGLLPALDLAPLPTSIDQAAVVQLSKITS